MRNLSHIITLLFVLVAKSIYSQECLNLRPDFIPNQVDSNNFYYFVSSSYFLSVGQKNYFQKKVLKPDASKGDRLMKGELEMLYFVSNKYDASLAPHVFLRVDVFPSFYMSSRFGAGVSFRNLNSSAGLFYGTYYRRVPYDGNFVTRRKKMFDNYNLYGFYLQSSIGYSSLFASLAFEPHKVYHSVMANLAFGEKLFTGKTLRTLGVVFSSEEFFGQGIGLSIFPMKRTRFHVEYITPKERDSNLQARLQNELSSGFLIGVSHTVN